MSSSESSDSPQVKLIREWGGAFEKIDMDAIAKTLHKDYRHTTYPRSIGRPDQNRDEWLKHIAGLSSLWTKVEQTIHSITDAPGKVVFHVTNNAKTSVGVDVNRESIFIAHMAPDEDGSLKIKQIEDFTDSKAYLDVLHAFAVAKGRKQ